MAHDPRADAIKTHKEWLGYLQPVGLVVSPPALADAGCYVDAAVAEEHGRFLAGVKTVLHADYKEPPSVFAGLSRTLIDVFGWQTTDFVPADDPRAEGLAVPLREYGETLRPTFAVPDDTEPDANKWRMLILEERVGTPLDAVLEGDARSWKASPQARFERLLRETGLPTGLLCNGLDLRLVYAPRGESPGHVTFPLKAMIEPSGRPIFAALFALLKASRVFATTGGASLNDILAESRKYQNTVSTELAKQVLAALYELLRGFQAADAQRKGELLSEVLAKDPDSVYAGQLTVLLRLVFLLYAEDRGLMSSEEVYVRNYSVAGLFDKLRADDGRHPDTMDQRYGAWARLLSLFRIVHDGAKAGQFHLPARHGYLFDPDRYPFLEGRKYKSERAPGERINPPRVSDGVVYRVLRNLLVLDGERLSYRALDVEQIGSVYEAMMGFRVEVATGRSIAVRPKKPHGAPVTIDLDKLLAEAADKRAKWFKEQTDLALTAKEAAALKTAKTPEEAVAAFAGKQARAVTPNIVPAGSMVLQPSDERRRSGSHYTPRSLTEPIVRKALEPVLKQLGESPTPKQILDLKVCDPAMGSGAFLVETCRQLGELLVKAWHAHARLPKIPPDEDELLHAQRLVAQRCVYGVDKNPMAVDLAKLSLWLTTLAKEHPFTFLNHALRAGDSLVGLTRDQIKRFDWADGKQDPFKGMVDDQLTIALSKRERLLDVYTSEERKAELHAEAESALKTVRFVGNLAVAAFFGADSDKKRKERRTTLFGQLEEYLRTGNMNLRPTKAEQELRAGDKPIEPFHWEIEFPEVFQREQPGFDCFVGNPPFAGKNTIADGNRPGFPDWLKALHAESHGNADLVAHFFRRAFNMLRPGGTFGLIATNTIAQGDTRSSGLRWICTQGGTIFAARRRYKWPGQAAVVVSVVHIAKSAIAPPFELDGRPVTRITAYLFHAGGHDDPAQLTANAGKSFQGCIPLGMGFTFDDAAGDVATPTSVMKELINQDPRNGERIFPFIGWDEVANSPTHLHDRYIISFETMDEVQARNWPALFRILEEKVRPDRMKQKDEPAKEFWWRFLRPRPEMQEAIRGLPHALVTSSQAMTRYAFARLPAGMLFSSNLNVFPFEQLSVFAALQCQPHEVWARFMGSTLKDDLSYTPSDCFETYPALEAVGQEYYEFRAALMVRNNEGLTKTYNRFHDPHEMSEDILKLRELHAAMDRAVLAAYGPPFSELVIPPCEFLLDYEDEEDEEETVGKRQKKKPWRFRWPDAFRDEVLALLLTLNKERAEAERQAAAAAEPAKKAPAKPRKKKGDQPKLPGAE